MLYQIAMSNAAMLEKSMWSAFERGNEQLAFKFYCDYCWYVQFAKDWIEGKF